uniref:RING-type domain-containing protein n=1 Tax=Rhodosorus marinus TaxID=101924 RepID=A0A7S2ZC67_9RHOD|mmetsp:Transcript_1309/g.3855  ORF Transcript_1309/g.3855 Transcript_1309/m.3855 type:complete len:165 (+) Transcript_1309:550-1044(+)|eukprot:CAMPEP_0113959178 /NCGR_PEP_ID=MMETSP0011_2-20120614/3992_1 /TAXON_ID=101924 /ORGANISM="Rhodosorus marinus" /LENGTH=164 /DNA_ID=CAMNT_0000970445 /DNA_START=13 /DNA_END=507 /DNA_ORIENTATION=+ /assembly_acc=CAM_ASM_000156
MASMPFPIQAGMVVGGMVFLVVWRLGVRRAWRRERERERRMLLHLDKFAPLLDEDGSEVELADGDCCICLSGGGGKPVRKILCGHSFHARCLERWVQYSVERYLDIRSFVRSPPSGFLVPGSAWPSCPLCKKVLPVIDEADIKEAVSAAIHFHSAYPTRIALLH